MVYLAVTQATADWLLGKTGLIDALHNSFSNLKNNAHSLQSMEFIEGPIRITASSIGEVVAIWNIDYLSGTGEEAWGFIRLDDNLGICNNTDISREILERCLYVINQRLQGLFIDGAYYHRHYPNGAHTCLAGRGTLARQWSIGYYERNTEVNTAIHHSIICVGPSQDFGELSKFVAEEASKIQSLVDQANILIAPGRNRKVAGNSFFTEIRRFLVPYSKTERGSEYEEVQVSTYSDSINRNDAYKALGLSYNEWLLPSSPLSEVQRRILISNAIERHPLRIVGPGGSGKTLLMQLLALRRIDVARQENQNLRCLYIVHNAAMAEMVKQRFYALDGNEPRLRNKERRIDVYTLAEYGREQLNLEPTAIIDPDAYEAKLFQLDQVSEALNEVMASMPDTVSRSKIFSGITANPKLFRVFSLLVMSEISTAIKGHGLEGDKKRYVQSERKLSRLHGLLTQEERTIIFHTYEKYHNVVFEQLEVLDTDDIALSLLGRLRTPIWELKRKKLGYDYVFVDETQLFNENERRVLPLLTTGASAYVPIVLALDEAQDVYSQTTAGMATLGIPDIANENLSSIHRSIRAIVRLAFFVIQRSTDLFGPDFPDFTDIAQRMEADNHPLAATPRLEIASDESKSLGKFIIKRIRELRKANLRQIAVICHAEQYWEVLQDALRSTDLPLHILLQRGEKLSPDQPLVVLTRPVYAGGQEFDAVLLVGLEQGVTPPRVIDNDTLSSAVEQQSVREMYLAITRARYRVVIIISAGSSPTSIISDAERAGLITRTLSTTA